MIDKDYHKIWYQAHKNERKIYYRNWYQAHKEQRREYVKNYRLKNREKFREYYRMYIRNHKEYVKNEVLKVRYGLTIEDFNNLLKKQDYKCAICGEPLDLSSRFKVHIEHNHKTGKVRGIVCNKCNQGLGGFRDNIEYLQKAIEYLKRNDYE